MEYKEKYDFYRMSIEKRLKFKYTSWGKYRTSILDIIMIGLH